VYWREVKRRFLQYTSQYKKVYWDPKKPSSTFLYWEGCTVELLRNTLIIRVIRVTKKYGRGGDTSHYPR